MNLNLRNRLEILLALLAGFVALPLAAQTNPATETGSNEVVVETPAIQSTVRVTPLAPISKNVNVQPYLPKEKPRMFDWQMSDNLRMALSAMSPFAMILGIVWIGAFVQHRKHKMMNDVLRAMIEKGLPVTPELVESLKSKKTFNPNSIPGIPGDAFKNPTRADGLRKRNDLRNGVMLTAIGLGLLIVAGKVGFILIFIGGAYLICALLQGKPGNDDGKFPQP